MRRSFLLAALATTVAAAPAIAQSKTGFGPIVGVNVTTGSLGDSYGVGWFVGGQFVKGTGFGSVIFEVTYNGFSLDDQIAGSDYSDDLHVWGFGLGPRFRLGPLHGWRHARRHSAPRCLVLGRRRHVGQVARRRVERALRRPGYCVRSQALALWGTHCRAAGRWAAGRRRLVHVARGGRKAHKLA